MARKPNISPTPCWDHATHVAGIVGAANNGQGVVGMLPGVEIRSLDVSESEGSVSCSTGLTTSNILSALDRVREDSFVDPKVSVVNMSLNSFGFPNAYYRNGILGFVVRLSASSMTVWVNLPSMPSLYSPGALIVQSAANNTVVRLRASVRRC